MDQERVVIQGVIEKIRRRPSVDLAAGPLNGSAASQSGNTSHAVVAGWVEDASAERCMICATRFTAFSRRHHCRACGNVVCKACSPDTVVIAEMPSAGSQRVCTQCFWGQELVHLSYSCSQPTVSPAPVQLTVTASSDPSGRSSGAIRSAFAPTNESASDAIEVRRNSSNSSISSRASRGSNALMQGGVDDGADQLFPTPLFAAKLKRADGSKVFINIGTNDVLLPTETIVTKHVVSDASSEFTCYDYVIHPERAVMYTLLVPDSSVDDLEPAKDVLQAKNKIVYDAVKLISLKYGNLGLTGVEPSYPETRHNHKGNIHPFQRSPSKVPVSSTARYNDEITWNHTSSTLTGSVSKEGMSENIVDPPALCKGWVTVLGSGGKGLIGIGNKKRFVVLDGGLFSVYKKESDTPPYGHHKKDSIVLDGAIILDSQNTVESAKVQRRSSSVDPKQAQVVAVNAKRRGSVFGVNKEAEVKRLFINSAHGGKRIDIECESAADRARWSLALTQHADYAALRVNQPNLVTDSFVDEMHSDSASVVSEVDARRSVSGSSTVVKAVRRGSAIPTTWSAYFPYMQEGESVLEAGEVTVREGIFGRYGPPFDLVLTTKGRLYLVDMDARDVNKEIDLVAMSTSPACAKIENEKIFSVLVGGVTYHIKDETGFKVQNWVTEINTVVRELSL